MFIKKLDPHFEEYNVDKLVVGLSRSIHKFAEVIWCFSFYFGGRKREVGCIAKRERNKTAKRHENCIKGTVKTGHSTDYNVVPRFIAKS